jgi:hypothetical protein
MRMRPMSIHTRIQQLRLQFGDNNCWPWPGAKTPRGYGSANSTTVGCRSRLAHRIVYTAEKGPIPPDMTLDHLCRNPPCVNPLHLEPVTKHVNQVRSGCPKYQAFLNGTCMKGHPKQPGKKCSVCISLYNKQWRKDNPEKARRMRQIKLARERLNPEYRQWKQAYGKWHYAANRALYIARARENKRKRREALKV